MTSKKGLVALTLGAMVLIAATGCGALPPSDPEPAPSSDEVPTPVETPAPGGTTRPFIVIEYTATFASPSRLVVTVHIENQGYDSFETSLHRFSVVVNNAEFPADAAGSDLRTVDLRDGETLTGTLSFEVPSGTASPGVGFSLEYSGDRLYHIWWAEATGTIVPAPSTTISVPVIRVEYSPTFAMIDSRYMLFVDVTIENRGYDSFRAAPDYFHAVVSNARFDADAGLSDLTAVDIPDGGTARGTLAFEVPTGTASSKVGFNLVYSGTRLYKVQWFDTSN